MTEKRYSIRPLYLQVRDALAQRIATGEWKPGDAIPNENDLARQLGDARGAAVSNEPGSQVHVNNIHSAEGKRVERSEDGRHCVG